METAPFLIWYDAEIIARHLRVGHPIRHDDIYATVKVITGARPGNA